MGYNASVMGVSELRGTLRAPNFCRGIFNGHRHTRFRGHNTELRDLTTTFTTGRTFNGTLKAKVHNFSLYRTRILRGRGNTPCLFLSKGTGTMSSGVRTRFSLSLSRSNSCTATFMVYIAGNRGVL